MRSGFRWYDSIFIFIFVYLFILQIQAIWPFTIDDMYISLRYAKHWAAGEGLLWNLNAPPVEGYSNFSFVALGALSLILNSNPVIALKIAGLIGLFFTCCFIFFISRFWFERRESLIPCIGLLLYKGQIIWAVSGFETAVYEALICGAVYFAFRGLGYNFFPDSRGKPQPVFYVLSGLMLAFAGMTRPEAPVFIALFFLLMCWDRPQTEIKVHWQGMALFVVTLILFYVSYFLWRWHYFGFLFPNSVYCKGLATSSILLDINYLKLIGPFIPLAVFACFKTHDKRHYFLWLPSVLYLMLLVGADPVVAFDNRLFLPAFVLFLPLALLGISYLVLGYLETRETVYTLSLYFICFCTAFFFIPTMSLSDYSYFKQNPVAGEQLRANVLQWLQTNAKPGDSVVLSDSGLIPYYSNLNFIDSYCLNNIAMTRYPKEKRYEQFCQQMYQEKPKIIILTSLIKDGQVIYTPGDLCLKKSVVVDKKYKLSSIFTTRGKESMYRYDLFTNF
jgi:hypothetical protein